LACHELLSGGVDRRPGRDHRGLRRVAQRQCPFGVLAGPVSGLGEAPIARILLVGERRLGRFDVDVGLRLLNDRLLRPRARLEARKRRLPLADDRVRMIQRGAKIAVIEANQRLAGPDVFIVLDQDFGDEPGDMRRYRRNVAADVGVVSRLDKAPDGPPVVAETRSGCREHARQQREQRPSQRLLGERPAPDASGDALNCYIGQRCLPSF